MIMNDYESLLHKQVKRNGEILTRFIHTTRMSPAEWWGCNTHTHFAVPIGSRAGRWDDQERATWPTLPSYIQQNIPYILSRLVPFLDSGSPVTTSILNCFATNITVPYTLDYALEIALEITLENAFGASCMMGGLPESRSGRIAHLAPTLLPYPL